MIIQNERFAAIELAAVTPLELVNGQPLRDFLLDLPATPALRPCAEAPLMSFDRIGADRAPVAPGPVPVARSRDLPISGWAVTPITNLAGSDVEMTLGTDVYPVYYGFERPDVAAYLKDPGATPSGFRAVIPSGRLKTGTQTLRMRVVSRDHACFFESAPVSLVVQ